jgi:hypothetical protein
MLLNYPIRREGVLIFGRSWVQISAHKLAIITVSMVFLSYYRQMWASALGNDSFLPYTFQFMIH